MFKKMDRMKFAILCGKFEVTIESSEGCIVDMDGPIWTIDTEHALYPPKLFGGDASLDPNVSLFGNEGSINIFQKDFVSRKYGKDSQEYSDVDKKIKDSHIDWPAKPVVSSTKKEESNSSGVGTELKVLLSYIGITSTPNCSCNQKAKIMDEQGIFWCKKNKEVILTWLKEEAAKRHLPFLKFGARKILNIAINRASKKGNKS